MVEMSKKCVKRGRPFSFPGGGGSIEPSGRTPPSKKGSIDRTPKILPRLTPGRRRRPRPKNRGKKKIGFLESTCPGGSESHHLPYIR